MGGVGEVRLGGCAGAVPSALAAVEALAASEAGRMAVARARRDAGAGEARVHDELEQRRQRARGGGAAGRVQGVAGGAERGGRRRRGDAAAAAAAEPVRRQGEGQGQVSAQAAQIHVKMMMNLFF